jgi:tripeptide aminopeptidase
LATQPKPPETAGRLPAEVRRIAALSKEPGLADAHRWFSAERAWINDQHLQLCRIPAPTFFEQRRAAWLKAQLESLGWNAALDRAGNVLASLDPREAPLIAVSAHLDTVFAPARPEEVYFAPDGRLFGPGVADNGSGLAALLALARVLTDIPALRPLAASLLLAANVGEEGEGNLSGMRHLCRQPGPLTGAEAIVVIDGPSIDHITTQALASRRYEVAFAGPGGHSWNDYGAPNPIHALASCISAFVESAGARLAEDKKRTFSFNFGIIEGGASVNSIPFEARAKLDLRSEAPETLESLAALLTSAVESSIERENRAARTGHLTAKVKELGARPGGKLPDDSALLRTVQAVDAHLKIRSTTGCASTDANIPLSLALPAVSIGAGGQGSGAHTTHEWYRPDGRELGLYRILLVLAALRESATGAPAA